jgi:hypothetical protein
MAAGSWKVFTNAKKEMGNGNLLLDTTTGTGWKIILLEESWAADLTDLSAASASITGNFATNGGTTQITLGTVTWTSTGTSWKFSAGVTGVQWTASGGPMDAAWAVVFCDSNTTPTADTLVAYVDLDTATTGPITVASGNTLTITLSNEFFSLGGAT